MSSYLDIVVAQGLVRADSETAETILRGASIGGNALERHDCRSNAKHKGKSAMGKRRSQRKRVRSEEGTRRDYEKNEAAI